jgi:hypothetical protein
MARIFILALFIFCSLRAASQGLPGYVLTLQGDTLRGIVRESAQQRRISLFVPLQPTQKFTAADIHGYGLLHNAPVLSYPVQRISGRREQQFALPKQMGAVKLYSFADELGLLLQPAGTDTLYELADTNLQLLLHRHLGQCSALNFTDPSFQRKLYTETRVRQIVAQYNRCVNPHQVVAPIKRTFWRHGLMAHTALLRLRQDADTRFNETSLTSSALQVGLAWTSLRASGFQSALVVSYLRLFAADPKVGYLERGGLLNGGLQLQQRIGKPFGLNGFVGGGISLGLSGGTYAGPCYQAQAGLLLPVGHRHEIQLAGVYQRYTDVNGLGAQLAYTLFQR